MSKLSRRTRDAAVAFCRRCPACRADAIRERARLQALGYGWRQA